MNRKVFLSYKNPSGRIALRRIRKLLLMQPPQAKNPASRILYCMIGKCSYHTKPLREDHTAAYKEIVADATAAGEESCEQDSLF
ncbi:hypothetical protein LQZ18_06685 [Lachnospiraceae bacterium ZAX-1]